MYEIFNTVSYRLHRNSTVYTSNEISITPQFTRPEFLPQLWKFLEYLGCQYALHKLHNFSGRTARQCSQKYKHIVFHPLHNPQQYIIFLTYFLKNLFYVVNNIVSRGAPSIIRYAYLIVPNIKNSIFCSLHADAAVVQEQENTFLRQVPLPRQTASCFPHSSKLKDIRRSFP
jgi:hypothetical protein